MCSQHRDDVLLASCRSSAACHRGAKAVPARAQKGLADGERPEGVFAVPLPGAGLAGVHCQQHGANASPEKPCIPWREEGAEGHPKTAKIPSIPQGKRSNRVMLQITREPSIKQLLVRAQ